MAQTKFKFVTNILCVRKNFLSGSSCSSLSLLFIPKNWVSSQVRRKHWSEQFKRDRPKKVLKVFLDENDNGRINDRLSLEETRSILKEKGVAPNKLWNKKPMYISCSGYIFDPYVPPKGDGQLSFVGANSVKQLTDNVEVKGRSYLALRKIHNLDFTFDVPTLAEKGKDLYVEAQKELAERNEDKLQDLVTEKAYEEMLESIKLRSIRWNFIQSLEPPRIVHIRCQEVISKGNVFAQVTVRLFSQQTLAVYDRFGRLIHGSEETVKDVLEYIVIEKHITNPHGSWKIHGKILPAFLS